MALVTTHRFNWMGYEGTESEALNLALLRPGSKVGNLRYTDYQFRQDVIAEIRMRLKLVKSDLGLLPPEDSAADADADDAIVLDSDDEQDNGESGEEAHLQSTDGDMASKLQERRRLMLGQAGYTDSDEDEDGPVYLFPKPPTEAEVRAAARHFAGGVRVMLAQRGETLVSFLDGAEFATVRGLKAHNAQQRAAVAAQVDGTGVDVPPEGEFDLTPLEAAAEERQQLRMKLDAVRCAADASYAAKMPAEETDKDGQPITNVTPEDGDEPTLVVKLNAAKSAFHNARLAYNKRARESAKRINTAIVRKQEEEEAKGAAEGNDEEKEL